MKRKVVVIGAGGHAKVCIDILMMMGEEIAYCLADSKSDDFHMGIPVLVGDRYLRILRNKGFSRAFIAIGANDTRSALAEKCIEQGYTLINAISPRSYISRYSKLGKGVAVMPGAIINTDVVIEDVAIINTGATIDHDCNIGKAVHVGPQCALAGNVTVGTGTLIGIGAVIIPNITIESGVTVGAGSVVIDHIPANSKVVGVPARITCNGRNSNK